MTDTQRLLTSDLLAQSYTEQHRMRATSNASIASTISSMASEYTERIVKFSKRRFWWFCGLGVIAVIILNLSFLPRTSLSRDYRRWHDLHLTKSDVKRNFLFYSSQPDDIEELLKNFTDINNESKSNLVGSNNAKLVNYVEREFKKFGFKPESYEYETSLATPISSSLRLYDDLNTLVYTAKLEESNFKTPAFFGFGQSGTVKAKFLYVGEGLNYTSIDPQDKIVIIESSNHSVSVVDKVLLAEEHGAKAVIHFYNYDDIPSQNTDANTGKAVIRDTVVYHNFGLDVKTPKIPSIPVSLKAIKPILDAHKADDLVLELTTTFETKKKAKLHNIVGSIRGIIQDGDIVIGAARDTFESNNPLSNHVILLEIMRQFHKLVELGWKPLRNIKFVSFDGSKDGLLGSQKYLQEEFPRVVAYVNIDSDAVRGSELKVDANPLLNHLLLKVSKLVPFPKDSSPFKSLPNTTIEDDVTLYKYWKLQDGNKINNELDIDKSDAFPFQYSASTPVINIKFDNDPIRDSSIYTPNSNFFSYDWLIDRQIDDEFVLHRVLVKYLGMLLIQLSEHEVVDFKARDYFKFIQSKVSAFEDTHDLTKWSNNDIPQSIWRWNEPLKFHEFVSNFNGLVNDAVNVSSAFDEYNKEVQEGLTQDYPWYQSFKKVKLWAQFKVSNYKLLHLDRGLSQQGWWEHLIYNHGVLGNLESALDNYDLFLTRMGKLADRLSSLSKKLS